jgi:hypothetical protein
MQAGRAACGQGVITIELIMPIIQLAYIKSARRADKLLTSDDLTMTMIWSVLDRYKERHGPAVITDDWFRTLTKGFDQWVPFFQDSGRPTDVNESQLIRMFSRVIDDTHQSAQQPPSAPSTPEQATRKIASLTPERQSLRELSDTTLLLPRALWTADREQVFLSQADALQMVAVHDAGALVGALLPGLAAARVTAALINWRAQQHTGAQSQEQTRYVPSDQLPTHAVLMGRYLDLLASPPQAISGRDLQQTQQQTSEQRQQNHLRRVVHDAGALDSALLRVLAAKRVATALAMWQAACMYSEGQQSDYKQQNKQQKEQQNKQQKKQQDKQQNKRQDEQQNNKNKRKNKQHKNTQQHKNTVQQHHDHKTTLKANTFRAGDDWAD